MLGVPYAYGKEKHISITFISNTFTEKNSLRTKIGIEILIIALSVFVMIIGGCMVASNAAGQISPALQLPMPVYYACVPICGVLMVIYSVERIYRGKRDVRFHLRFRYRGGNRNRRRYSSR